MVSVSVIVLRENGIADRRVYNIYFDTFQTISINFQMQDQKGGPVKLSQGEWKFWLIQAIWEGKVISYHLDTLVSVGCLDNLHKYCNTMPAPSEIKMLPTKKVSIAFFRNNVKPAWEEQENKGRLVYECSADLVNYAWRQLIWMCCNGDFVEESESDPNSEAKKKPLVNGVVVGPSRRRDERTSPNVYTLEIWGTDEGLNSREPSRSRDLLKEKLKQASEALQGEYALLADMWDRPSEGKRFKRDCGKDKH